MSHYPVWFFCERRQLEQMWTWKVLFQTQSYITNSSGIFFKKLSLHFTYMHGGVHVWHMCGSQRTICGNQFSSTLWALVIEFRSSSLAGGTFTCYVILSALSWHFQVSIWWQQLLNPRVPCEQSKKWMKESRQGYTKIAT